MLEVRVKNKFRKDVQRLIKRGKSLSKLHYVMDDLAHEKTLNPKLLDHALRGEYVACRECHIEPDWLLIYQIIKKEKQILFIRTGSHSDLF